MIKAGCLRDLIDLLVGEDMEAMPAGGDTLPLSDRRHQIVRMNDGRGEAKEGEKERGFHGDGERASPFNLAS